MKKLGPVFVGVICSCRAYLRAWTGVARVIPGCRRRQFPTIRHSTTWKSWKASRAGSKLTLLNFVRGLNRKNWYRATEGKTMKPQEDRVAPRQLMQHLVGLWTDHRGEITTTSSKWVRTISTDLTSIDREQAAAAGA